MMNDKIRHCTYCKKMTVCEHEDTKRTGIYEGDACRCNLEGISFTSIKTSIHQDCLVEMMEKVIDKLD